LKAVIIIIIIIKQQSGNKTREQQISEAICALPFDAHYR